MLNYIVTWSIALLILGVVLWLCLSTDPFKIFKQKKGKKGEVIDFESWKNSYYKRKRAN